MYSDNSGEALPKSRVDENKPDIAIVVLDTLRKDAFDAFFRWLPGTRFENAYSTSNWTVPAHASLLTGRYPSDIDVHSRSLTFDCTETSIAEILKEKGYTTRLWTENTHISSAGNWDRGFDEFLKNVELSPHKQSVKWFDAIDGFIEKKDEVGFLKYATALRYAISSEKDTIYSLYRGLKLALGVKDTKVSGQDILKRLKSTTFEEKSFLMMNLMGAHAPHYPPKRFRSINKVVSYNTSDSFNGVINEPKQKKSAYYDSTEYLSSIYREIFNELQKHFDIIITVSDHGELLGEHGIWGHTHGIYPELVQVPLTISTYNEYKDLFEQRKREDTVSILDIFQTITDLVGAEVKSQGRNIISQKDSQKRFVEYHGVLSSMRDNFEDNSDILKKIERPLGGVATENGYYCYQTYDQNIESSGNIPDKKAKKIFEDKFERKTSMNTLKETKSLIKKRLRDLGYQ